MKSKILLAVVFLVCFAGGFGVVKMVKYFGEDHSSIAQSSSSSVNVSHTPKATGVVDGSTGNDSSKEDNNNSNSTQDEVTGNSMLAQMAVENMRKSAEEAKRKNEAIDRQNENVKRPDKGAIVSELNKIIKNRGNKYPHNVHIVLSGNGPREQATSISMIYQYLQMGVWTSAVVTDVDCNPETGRVSTIYVRVSRAAHVNDNTDDDE